MGDCTISSAKLNDPIFFEHSSKSENSHEVDNSCLNWDKLRLIAQLAVVVAIVATAFFMNVPLLGLGVALYGVLDVILYGVAESEKNGKIQQLNKEIISGKNKAGKVSKLKDKIKELRESKEKYKQIVGQMDQPFNCNNCHQVQYLIYTDKKRTKLVLSNEKPEKN